MKNERKSNNQTQIHKQTQPLNQPAIQSPAALRVLKVGQCPSITGASQLTYHIGCNEQGALAISIQANSSSGYFSEEWVSLKAIEETLMQTDSPFSSIALKPLYQGKSQNNPGFLMAILLHLGLVGKSGDKLRSFNQQSFEAFIEKHKPSQSINPKTDTGSANPTVTDKPSA